MRSLLNKYQFFSNIKGIIKEDYKLSHLTWFKTGGKAVIFFKPHDVDDLIYFLKERNKDEALSQKKIFIIGAGSNIIIDDGDIDAIIIKLTRNFTDIKIIQENGVDLLYAGSGCLNFNLANFAKDNKISNFEFLIGIPGTVGGGVQMNAGAYQNEFANIVNKILVVDYFGNKKTIFKKDIDFGYRNSNLQDYIVIGAYFDIAYGDQKEIISKMQLINSKRSNSQPITSKTGGSTFVNPVINDQKYHAWELIDKSGLRGKIIGGAQISELHCNFLINYNNASSQDLIDLIKLAQKEVMKNFNIKLKTEIKFIR